MPVDPAYSPDPQFERLGPEFADPVAPADFPSSLLRFRNDRHAAAVGLAGLTPAEWLDAFARFTPLPRNQRAPLALRYHGHQFRVYNPDLGDGRGFLFAQVRGACGRLLDLGTKGSGRTPWSRSGDGRLTLKGGVREVLATALLEALGVETSKSFSLIETGEALPRNDEPSPTRSAVLTRLSFSHIRFGTFQRLAVLEEPTLMAQLLEHVRQVYAPDLKWNDVEAAAVGFLDRSVRLSARLTAQWMAAGFVHGVLNTDNMNINGESFDYGPYRFLPRNDPNFTAAYFDHSGLYAFGRQPEAVFWNLQQLAGALLTVAPESALIGPLSAFQEVYRRELIAAILKRLGLRSAGPDADAALAGAVFRALAAGGERLRWEPFFFDFFCGAASSDRALGGRRGALYREAAFDDFRARLNDFDADRVDRLSSAYFKREEPEELLIEDIDRLWDPIARDDDWSLFYAKLEGVETARQAYDLGAAPSAHA